MKTKLELRLIPIFTESVKCSYDVQINNRYFFSLLSRWEYHCSIHGDNLENVLQKFKHLLTPIIYSKDLKQ
jgi:hypothetical protein